jgi:hypothetical protein
VIVAAALLGGKVNEKYLGYGLVGVAALHLALGTSDPLSGLWTALSTSIEIAVLLFGVLLIFGGHGKRLLA